ncbi:MAG: hypothetical protein IT306_12805 [Chloroflexi bacterium]|nr:hypothetical protein [Chloroflexota bacterium]
MDNFDLPWRWLEAMSERGVPEQIEAELCAAIDGWRAFEDPSDRQFAERAIGVAGHVMTGFLAGMRGRGDEPVLILAESYPSPLSSFTGLADVQWDIFPPADCPLRSAERRGQSVAARVAIVPRLWVEAMADP